MKPDLVDRKTRLRIGFIFGVAYIVFARPTPGSLLLGLPVAVAGLAVRAWAAGHIMKNAQLATTGPYAHTRNPLYFGSFLLAAGFALVVHWSLVLVVIALFAFIYGPTIEQERELIRSRFPEAYAAWEANVPAFAPRITPWRGAGAAPEAAAQNQAESFSFSLYVRHREWRAAVAFVAVVAWLVARMQLGF